MTNAATPDPLGRMPALYPEDLAANAAFLYRAAESSCSGCNLYHRVWGYIRLAGLVNGVETDRAVLEPVFRRYAPEKARVLITGAADTGVPAMIARALQGRNASFTLADRCATPLALCDGFARRHSLALTTVRHDLIATPLPGPFDLMFGHLILRFIPDEARVRFFGNLRASLSPGGALVILARVPQAARRDRNYTSGVIDVLAARGIALPDDTDSFLANLEAYGRLRNSSEGDTTDLPFLLRQFAEAGLSVVEHIQHDKRRTIPLRENEPARVVPTHILVAKRL